MDKKLSICMIVKDEEKNLRRCLDSLKPLLETSYTELIIVDTGSTDQTIKIAKEYTQRVYFHEWNGNFSDMRNISISYAEGEWIFIIDADEELETPSELMNLLTSSEINSCNTIRVREKNLLSIKLNKYVYHVQERLFRNNGTFHYKGTIHNQPIYQHPVLTADIWLMHYGYINEDKELMEKKFKRTASMLRKELEKDPEHVYYRFQLARSYMMHNEDIIALEEIEKAYQSMKKQAEELVIHRYYVFGEYARMSLNAKKFKQVIEICKEGLTYNKVYLDLYYYMGHAYFALEEYEDGLETLKRYMDLHEKYHKNELDLSNFTAIEMYSLDKDTRNNTLDRIVDLIYKDSNLIYALTPYKMFLDKIENQALKAKLLTKVFILENKVEELLDLYKNMEEEQRHPYINYLEILKNDFDEDQLERFQINFSTNEDAYGLLNQIRITDNKRKLLTEFINKYDIIKFSDEIIIEFVKYLIEYNYLNRFFKKTNSEVIKKIVKVLIDQEEKEEYFLQSLRNDFGFNDFQSNRVYIAIANVLLLSRIEENKRKKEDFVFNLKEIFNRYIEKGIENIRYTFNPNHIRLIYSTHENKEEKFLMIMHLYKLQYIEGNQKLAMKYLKEAGETYPYFSHYLSILANEIKSEIQKKGVINSILEVKSQSKELKILHGTIEIANQMNTLVKAQNQFSNVSSFGINYHPSYLSYDNAHILDINKVEDRDKVTMELFEAANETFDVFHFHYNTSLLPNLADLPLLKENKKKIFMHHWGTDVRRLSIANKLNPYAKSKNDNEEQIIKQLHYLGSYIDDCIIADAELYEYVKGFYNRVHIVRQALNLSEYTPNPEFEFRKTKPVIVHAPTSSDFKGTKFVNAAIEELKLNYDFEYKLVQNMSHEEAKRVYQEADIIIDQLHGGGYGLFALEAMAMEKPVISYISEFMKDYYPEDLPILSANPDNIKEKIEYLIKDVDLRNILGKKGIKYVEKYHNDLDIAQQLIQIYKPTV
ncbi:glycosyltransferase [Bacillus sp. REN10]|uniref:glycosyltransferase n=1 Tax=Bacillus sp. REN10 TaxID=2782541 RepID=UPI00193AE75F|nr:glycosyltransferase [Bacillus sp. REN10]